LRLTYVPNRLGTISLMMKEGEPYKGSSVDSHYITEISKYQRYPRLHDINTYKLTLTHFP